jgi:TetR/AcrR family transcriptional repressor of nem operon
MGSSQAEKARTHERIVAIAAKRLRERGLDGIGVADLMQEAGLTVGGFYKHFASRDALVAEAIGTCFGAWRKRIEAGEEPNLPAWIDGYLSPAHRDDPGAGCPFGALAADLARHTPKMRALATAEIRGTFLLLGALLAKAAPGAARAQAILNHSALLGALSLARIVDDPALSDEIMATVAAALNRLNAEA